MNAAVELGSHDGPGNDAVASAQALTESFLTLDGNARRGAVLGTADGAAAVVGPDAFGYEAIPVPFAFEDIRPTGTPILQDADDQCAYLAAGDLAGFSFDFYGRTYTDLFVSSNGLITFGDEENDWWNTDLTDFPDQAAIAPFWYDLDNSGPADGVYYQVRGTGDRQRLIVQWNDVGFWGNPSSDLLTFQGVLYEADGTMQFNYADLSSSDDPGNEGAWATVGIKDDGLQGPDGNRLLVSYLNGPNAYVGSGQSTRVGTRASFMVDPVDSYAIALSAGQTVTIGAAPVFDDPAGQPRSDLDLQLLVVEPDGTTTTITRPNRHPQTTFTASADGTYVVRVVAESGAGEYVLSISSDALSNRPPIARDDAAALEAGQSAEIDVLANDADADGDALTVALVSGPANGTLDLRDDGSFSYTPDADFNGADAFTYRSHDPDGAVSDVATVSILVRSVNDAPVNQLPGTQRTVQGMPLIFTAAEQNAIAADDVDAGAGTIEVTLGVQHGGLTVSATGVTIIGNGGDSVTIRGTVDDVNAALDGLIYQPHAGYAGDDLMTVTTDDQGNSGLGGALSDVYAVAIAVEPQVLAISLTASGMPFGDDAGSQWAGSTVWVNVYVQDLRDVPQGVVGGTLDLFFDTIPLAPTGNVAFGAGFELAQQGRADDAAGMVDEAGALTAQPGAGAPAPFVSWEFRRDGRRRRMRRQPGSGGAGRRARLPEPRIAPVRRRAGAPPARSGRGHLRDRARRARRLVR